MLPDRGIDIPRVSVSRFFNANELKPKRNGHNFRRMQLSRHV